MPKDKNRRPKPGDSVIFHSIFNNQEPHNGERAKVLSYRSAKIHHGNTPLIIRFNNNDETIVHPDEIKIFRDPAEKNKCSGIGNYLITTCLIISAGSLAGNLALAVSTEGIKLSRLFKYCVDPNLLSLLAMILITLIYRLILDSVKHNSKNPDPIRKSDADKNALILPAIPPPYPWPRPSKYL